MGLRVAPSLWSLLLAVLMLGGALGPGYVLTYDMVWVPDLSMRGDFWGTGSSLPRAVPSDLVVALLDEVVPGMLLQKAVLLGALVLAGTGAARLVSGPGLVGPLAERRVLLNKEAVAYYESVTDFVVAERDGRVVGCGALHVLWEDLGEIRTLAVDDSALGRGIGSAVLERLVARALDLGLSRLFCLTFETAFFRRHGFEPVGEPYEEAGIAHVRMQRALREPR